MNKAKNKIPSITNLATVTALNAKINEIKHKTSDTTNLAATTALAAVENKILSGSNLLLTMIMMNILLLKSLIS